jgi:crotonobetainyl-CoA:carnitine CoA-transferase CaiB-like acyl-CoA transferase
VAKLPRADQLAATAPLGGVRILDLTRYMAGPYGTMLLAQMGAEVIKIEPPRGGDPMRRLGAHAHDDSSPHFASGNVSKHSVTLDVHRPEGRRVFLELVAHADVVVENWRPGTLAGLGLDWDTLRAAKPDVILASVSGFGQTGPWRDRSSFDLVAQAVGGGMSITGEPGRPPARAGIAIGDLAAGLFVALGIVAALHRRRTTGEGDWIDVAMMDAQLSLLNYVAHGYWASGLVPEPEGSGSGNIVPYQAFATPTGSFAVAAVGDRFWAPFCRAIERPELADDPRFSTNAQRCEHRDVLVPLLERHFAARPREAWVGRLAAEGVPVGPVHRIDEALASEQARARDMVVELKDASGARLPVLGAPVKFRSADPVLAEPPALGQHTHRVLRDLLGYDDATIETLKREGVA